MISVAQQSVCLAPCPVRAVASLNGRLIEYPEKDEFRRDDCALRRILVAFVYVREGEPPKPDAAQPESIEINNASREFSQLGMMALLTCRRVSRCEWQPASRISGWPRTGG